MKKIIETKNAPSPVGPYNQAIIANGILYCSGQIAIDPSSGVLITDDITKETTQVMKNIEAILKAAGSSFEQVIKCSIFMAAQVTMFVITMDLAYHNLHNFYQEHPMNFETFQVP